MNEVSTIVPSDKDFEDSFSLVRVPRAVLARYYLIALERGFSGEKEPELVPNTNEEQVNLEHVLPKRANATDWGKEFNGDERKSYPFRLGNLALLQKGPNGKIGNKAFAAKRAILKASKFSLTKEISKQADWTKEAIVDRQKRLAKLAPKVWPRS